METTLTLAQRFGVSPFDIFEQDTDEVILIINHFIEKGATATAEKPSGNTQARVRVNDKTATGGWW